MRRNGLFGLKVTSPEAACSVNRVAEPLWVDTCIICACVCVQYKVNNVLEVGLVNNEHFLGCAESAVCKNATTIAAGI